MSLGLSVRRFVRLWRCCLLSVPLGEQVSGRRWDCSGLGHVARSWYKSCYERTSWRKFDLQFQGHPVKVIYFSIFGFYDLNFVENDTNLITLSHLHQKISRLTNNGKNSVFLPLWCTFAVMTYVTWQHQDDDTCQNVSPIPSNRYNEANFAHGIIKKVTGKNAKEGGTHPLGHMSKCVSHP